MFAPSPFGRSLLIRGAGALVSFALGVAVARILSPADLGRYGILFSFVTLVSLPFTVGLPNFLTQEVPKNRDRESVRRLINRSIWFASILALVYVMAGIGFFLAGMRLADWRFGWLSVLLLAPVMGLDTIQGGALRGLGSANLSQVPTLIVRPGMGLLALGAAVLLGAPSTLETALVSYAVGCCISFVTSLVLMRRGINRVDQIEVDEARPIDLRNMASLVGSFSLFGIAGVLTGTIDMMVLEVLGDYVGAGNYRVALQGVAFVILGHNAIGNVTYVQLAQLTGGRSGSNLEEVCDRSLRWQMYSTLPVIVVIILVGLPVIRMVFGTEYSDAYPLLVVLCIGHLATIMVGASSYLVLLANRQIHGAAVSILAILITVIVAGSMHGQLGAVAVALGSAIGAGVRSVGYLLIARSTFEIDPGIIGYISRRLRSY